MKVAAVHALKNLVKLPASEELLAIYKDSSLTFGKDYFIPKPFDPRLIEVVPKAIFDAAVASGASRQK